jgi:prophage regulatory protein
MEQATTIQRRLLNLKQLRAMGIPWSRETLWRKEASNKFPRRVYLGKQTLVWLEDEILEWLAQRAGERAGRVYHSHD